MKSGFDVRSAADCGTHQTVACHIFHADNRLTWRPICDTYHSVIRSFADKRTAAVWAGRLPKGLAVDLANASRRKLRLLAAARSLLDLRVPLGNRLEALAVDRTGQHSIRVNDQWRVCFVWRSGDAFDVEIVDYY